MNETEKARAHNLETGGLADFMDWWDWEAERVFYALAWERKIMFEARKLLKFLETFKGTN